MYCNKIEHGSSGYAIQLLDATITDFKFSNNSITTSRADGHLVQTNVSATGATFCNSGVASAKVTGGGVGVILDRWHLPGRIRRMLLRGWGSVHPAHRIAARTGDPENS